MSEDESDLITAVFVLIFFVLGLFIGALVL